MRKFFNSDAVRCCAFLLVAGLCLFGGDVIAQDNMGTRVLTESTRELKGLTDSLLRLLQVILGLGALVSLVVVVYQMFKAEREVSTKLAWWLAGLTVGFVLLTVVKNMISSVA